MSRGRKAAIDDKAELTRQRATISQLVRRGQADQVLTVLRGRAAQTASAGGALGAGAQVPTELAAPITSVEGHRPAIVASEAEKAAGERVGSGAVEKAGDVGVNRRFKGRRGMRWGRNNADSILALRTLHLNGDWDAHWQKRRKPQGKAA